MPMVERCEDFRLSLEAKHAVNVAGKRFRQKLGATSRPNLVSPIPPVPIGARISYDPSLVSAATITASSEVPANLPPTLAERVAVPRLGQPSQISGHPRSHRRPQEKEPRTDSLSCETGAQLCR
jgi:hypothetical protein